MRPRSSMLRYAFRAAQASLKSKGEKITVNTLAREMGANFKTVQRFLYQNKDLWEKLSNNSEKSLYPFSKEKLRETILEI